MTGPLPYYYRHPYIQPYGHRPHNYTVIIAPIFPHNNDNDPILRGNWGFFSIIWGEINKKQEAAKIGPLDFLKHAFLL